MTGLREALPLLTPLAVEWARRVSSQAAAVGLPLAPEHAEVARRIGVGHPEDVRIFVSSELPFPDHPMLRAAALETGLLGPNMAGLTLGHTIFIRDGQYSFRLLSHELRHVAQYEAAGSIDAFLPQYLAQIVEFGYDAAPYEVDARSHEIAG
jgi:Domain of unknown function (DUF4157)